MFETALYIVPTPIGNLDDITIRAVKTLESVDFIACEDTRHTGILLKLLNISGKKLISYHDHNEIQKAEEVAKIISEGKSVALVSDAGTPLISDPGYRLVQKAIESGCKIVSLPGATAFVPAIAASGLAVHGFSFFGFIPQKKGRKTFLENMKNSLLTSVFYESPHRLPRLLKEIKEIFDDDRKIVIAKEISKIHETYVRTTTQKALEDFENLSEFKGEFVILIDGKNQK
ncbi:MAG: 16S rRNA (cytidine(1402)-2'-O)-methyltransferase [Candidatus Kapabacteria bacterium]|nr:16S rRNA (cytidine(1402)-2'-O)-methyltransferase [Candidatus Kapabacteria bacterium]